MAKKKKDQQQGHPSGRQEQLDLIDVAPENAKAIIAQARRYKAAQRQRLEALAEETARKQDLLSLIRVAKLARLDDGTIRFKHKGFQITVTPRDELVKVEETQDGDNATG